MVLVNFMTTWQYQSQSRPLELSKEGQVLEAAIQAAATVIISLKDSLNEWDGKVGDGDCGSTVSLVF
jgi:dihydroxyacetone kinase